MEYSIVDNMHMFKDVVRYPLTIEDMVIFKQVLNSPESSERLQYQINDDTYAIKVNDKFIGITTSHEEIISLSVFKGTINLARLSAAETNPQNDLMVNAYGPMDIYVINGVFTTNVIDYLLHGQLRSYCLIDDEVTLVEETEYVFGKKHGLQILYSENLATPSTEWINWIDDKKDGPYKAKTNFNKVTGYYVNDKKDGVWRLYDMPGNKIKSIKRYSAHLDNNLGYIGEYDKEGNLIEEGFIFNNVKHGPYTSIKEEKCVTEFFFFGALVDEELFKKQGGYDVDNILNTSIYYSKVDGYFTKYTGE